MELIEGHAGVRRARGGARSVRLVVERERDPQAEARIRGAHGVALAVVVEAPHGSHRDAAREQKAWRGGSEAVSSVASVHPEVVGQPPPEAEEILGVGIDADIAIERELPNDLGPIDRLERELADGAGPIELHEELADAHAQIADVGELEVRIEDGARVARLEVVAAEGELDPIADVGVEDVTAQPEAQRADLQLVAHLRVEVEVRPVAVDVDGVADLDPRGEVHRERVSGAQGEAATGLHAEGDGGRGLDGRRRRGGRARRGRGRRGLDRGRDLRRRFGDGGGEHLIARRDFRHRRWRDRLGRVLGRHPCRGREEQDQYAGDSHHHRLTVRSREAGSKPG